MQDRSEQFDVGPVVHVGRVDQRRAQERAVGDGPFEMADRTAAAHHQFQEALGQQVGAFIVDHRTHERGGGGVRLIDDDAGEQFGHFGHQWIVEFLIDDQAARGGAALPGAGEGGLHDNDRGGGQIGRIPHHDRVVAAHFEREDLFGPRRELAVERDAGVRRSGEQQPVDAVMPGQRLALGSTTDDQADAAFGDAAGVEAIDQERADRGGLFGRFEHHGVPGEECWDDVAVGQMRREIIRAEHREHAVRLVAQRHAPAHLRVEPPLRRALGISGDRDIDLGDDGFDFGPRFPQRLAGFARDQIGERVGARAHDIGEPA